MPFNWKHYIPVPLQRPRNFCLGIPDFEPACIAQLIQVELLRRRFAGSNSGRRDWNFEVFEVEALYPLYKIALKRDHVWAYTVCRFCMFVCSSDEQSAHIQSMENLKAQNRSCRERVLREWSCQIHQKGLLQAIRRRIRLRMNSESEAPCLREKVSAANYFSEHRIAVYTCIIGNYDQLAGPACQPNNIDYFVIADTVSSAKSPWNFL